MSIQKTAAELAEEFESCGDEYTETDIAYRMADLLKQVASMGVDQTHAATVIEHIGFVHAEVVFDGIFNMEQLPLDTQLFTQQALDAARLAGFEAGQNRPWAARKIESLIQERDAAIARADSAFESGRRKGVEDAADKAEAISEEERRFGEMQSHDPLFSFIQADAMAIVADAIRELIKKESA